MPSELQDDKGRSYELVTSIQPGGTFGDTAARVFMKFGQDSPEILEWAPTDPAKPWSPASSYIVKFGKAKTLATSITAVPVVKSRFPAYGDALLLGQVHAMFDMRASDIRGHDAEKQHNYPNAVKWYREAAAHAFPRTWAPRYQSKADRFNRLTTP